MESLKDTQIVVTGGASGIGFSCVQNLLNYGSEVAVIDRNEDLLKELPQEDRLCCFTADLSYPDQASGAFQEIGKRFKNLKGAINCAGELGPYAPLDDIDFDKWQSLISTNLDSMFLSLKEQMKLIKKTKINSKTNASIVNISSALGLTGFENASPYVASKHGIIGLTKSVALELAPLGVRVNAIAPGAVDTPLFRSTTGSTPEGFEAIRSRHPLGRIASSNEMASVAIFLLSDASSFVTGSVLCADGGWTTP